MFGMSKKQFLKKSKNYLKDIGIELLLVRELYTQETRKNIDIEEAHHKLEKIRKRLENTFFKYERLKPPSKCKQMQINLLSATITLQESIAINSEYIILAKDRLNEDTSVKLKTSIDELEKFRKDFMKLSQKVDFYLKQL